MKAEGDREVWGIIRILWGRMHLCVYVRGSNLFFPLHSYLSISFALQIQYTAWPCGKRKEKAEKSKQRRRLVMQNQQSIVFVNLGECFKQSAIIYLASSLSPVLFFFLVEKIT